VGAGFHQNLGRQTLIQVRSKGAGVLGHLQELFAAACGHEQEPLAVHRDFDVVRIFHAPHQIERVPPEPQPDGVLAVQGKGVLDHHPPASARREPLDMLVLR
jgi:hypothetical protein